MKRTVVLTAAFVAGFVASARLQAGDAAYALPKGLEDSKIDVPADNATRSWRLASDTYDRSIPGGYSSHGDWFNGWNQDIMKTFIQQCDRAAIDCHANLLGDGRELY